MILALCVSTPTAVWSLVSIINASYRAILSDILHYVQIALARNWGAVRRRGAVAVFGIGGLCGAATEDDY